MHHQTAPMSEAPILVALDLGEHCRDCLEQAWRMAVQREQSLIVIHVAHETAQTAGMYQRNNHGSFMLPIPEIAKNLLADFVAEFSRNNPEFRLIDSRQIVVTGIPETRIPELAKRYHASAIVIGNRQRSGIAGLLQRSIGQMVLNSAHCPVFLLNSPDQPISAEPIPTGHQDPGSRSALHFR